MYEVIEKFENYLKDNGYVIHETLNTATGQRVIAWIDEKNLLAGACPASYFDKFYTQNQETGIDETNIGDTEFKKIVDKFTEEF